MLKLFCLKGKAHERWHIGSGTAPIIFVDLVKEKTASASMGKVTANAEIRSILEDAALKTAEERGLVAVLVPPSVSERTVRNYKAFAASADGASLCRKVQQKTDSRHTAENSIMSTVSFLW